MQKKQIRNIIRNIINEANGHSINYIMSIMRSAFDDLDRDDIVLNDSPENDWIDVVIFVKHASASDLEDGMKGLENQEIFGDSFKVVKATGNRIVLRFNRDVIEETTLTERKINPWAICTSKVGRKNKKKYESCVMSIKSQQGITKEWTEPEEQEEAAVSKSQQRLMGQVHAIQTGQLNPEDIDPKYRKTVMKVAKSIKSKDAKEFASTTHKGIPEKVKNEDAIAGGMADKKDESQFDPQELAMGIKIEREHTNDPEIAKEIAMDHLVEFPNYYSALKRMESGLKQKKGKKLFIDKSLDNVNNNYKGHVTKFIYSCCNKLGIDRPFNIYLKSKRGGPIITTASYNTANNDINIYAKGRHIVDILRSISHEIKHLKQNIDGELNDDSGKDGSPQENEAHAFAGLMIRKFGKQYPEIYE